MNTSPTLICIPDISGFTQFMSDTDIGLSAKVISTLLNKVIYANEIGLKLSEIEGDAVLFFRHGELPTLKELVDQCKNFYFEFYEQLNLLHKKNEDHDDQKNIRKMLGLKIVLHYGKEVGSVPIGKNIKLMGEDIITAHRLLKNKVKLDEYILISDDLLSHYDASEIREFLAWDELKKHTVNYEHIGKISYHFINLDSIDK